MTNINKIEAMVLSDLNLQHNTNKIEVMEFHQFLFSCSCTVPICCEISNPLSNLRAFSFARSWQGHIILWCFRFLMDMEVRLIENTVTFFLPTIFSTWYQNGYLNHHIIITLPQEKWLPKSAQNMYTKKFSKVKAIQLMTWELLSIELSSGITNC